MHRLTGTLSFVGTLSKHTTYALTASISFVSALKRFIVYRLEAALNGAGRLQRAALRQLEGVLAVSGNLSRKSYYPLSASVTFVGTTGRSVLLQFRAALELVGNLMPIKRIVQIFAATFSFSGQITRRSVMHVLEGALGFVGSLIAIGGKRTKPITDAIILRQEYTPNITLRRTETGYVYSLVDHLGDYPEAEFESITKKRYVFGRKGNA